MNLDKHQLRTFYKDRRAALSHDELEQKSQQVLRKTMTFLNGREDLVHFHLFFPIVKQHELNTYLIKEYLENRGSFIYTSRVEPGSMSMHTLLLKPNTKFRLDKWGIPIPLDFELKTNRLIQVVFVPLLAFDKQGNRIGFGKGYYDVFLSSLGPDVLKIGLSIFTAELIIPSDPHDIPLDYCITPDALFTF